MIENTLRKMNKSFYDIILFLVLITANLGEKASIYGIKLSWLFSVLFILIIFVFYYNNTNLFQVNNNIKYLLYFVVFWLLYCLFQLLFLVNQPDSISSFIMLVINCFLIFQIALVTKNIKDAIFFNKALIIVLIINVSIGIWEILTGNHIVKLESERNIEYYSNKALAVFGNGNDFATFLYCGIIVLFVSFFYEKKHKIIYILSLFASLFLIFIIGARGPLFGIIIFFMTLPICYFLIKFINKTILSIIAIFLISLSIIYLLFHPLTEIVYRYSTSADLNSDLYRIDLINWSLQLFLQSYFLGVGPGQSTNLLGINPHNFFIELLADYGIFVFCGIVLMFIKLFFSFNKIQNIKLASLNMAFVVSFFIASSSSSSANRIRITWIIITILLLLTFLEEKNNA